MAISMSMSKTTPNSHSLNTPMYSLLLLFLSVMIICINECDGFGTFGFDMHHRYSDPVKGILAVDDTQLFPEKGSLQYYAVMAHRDRFIHGRNLLANNNDKQMNESQMLTFAFGNETYKLDSFGYLHYANVSVGTPSLSFMVALDTGSNLFWLPCDCNSCVHGLQMGNGDKIDFNIYSPNGSKTSIKVPCNSDKCGQQRRCASDSSSCPYQVLYLSNDTSSTGFLVEDVLHLTTDHGQSKDIQAQIMFGCGKIQTGSFLSGAAPNGLFGLGIDGRSVPSMLAKEGITSNSFSMCFGSDNIGRITFGDKGSSDQGETPLSLRQAHPTYNISITQVIVGGRNSDMDVSAIFDSGTSFTYLNDPAYTFITESFNSETSEKRHSTDSGLPFEYCYDLSPNQENISVPSMKLVMKGGEEFSVFSHIETVPLEDARIYCLAVVKSGDVNIIGQNFMAGYRIIFDREKMVLGWKPSNCYDTDDANALPITPPNSKAIPPAVAVNPEATAGVDNKTQMSGASPVIMFNYLHLTTFYYAILIVVSPFLSIY